MLLNNSNSQSYRRNSVYSERVLAEAFNLSSRKDGLFEEVLELVDGTVTTGSDDSNSYVEAMGILQTAIPRLESEFESALLSDPDLNVFALVQRFSGKISRCSYAVIPPSETPANDDLGAICHHDSIIFLAETIIPDEVAMTVTAFHEYIHLVAGCREFKNKFDYGFRANLKKQTCFSDTRIALDEGFTELTALNLYLANNPGHDFNSLNVSAYDEYVKILRYLHLYFISADPLLVTEEKVDGAIESRSLSFQQLLKMAYFDNTLWRKRITYNGQVFENYSKLLQYYLDSHFGVSNFLNKFLRPLGRHYRQTQNRKKSKTNNTKPFSLNPLLDATIELVATRDVPKFLHAVK
jgi:hypothetical protein